MKLLGSTVENARGVRSIVVHPFARRESLLSEAEYKEAANQGTPEQPVHGYKGLSFLTLLPSISHLMPLDYLHTVCLGVTGKMLDLWFKPEHKEYFSISKCVKEVDQELLAIRPPSFIVIVMLRIG